MKCENCGNQLVGATIICRVCNHNNAMQRVRDWRSNRPVISRQSDTRQISPINSTQSSEIGAEADANLLQFPASSEPTSRQSRPVRTTIEVESELSEYPPWRAQLKEKVRQARERRLGQTSVVEHQPDEAALDPNPIVAAALKRIRRSSNSPAAPVVSTTARTPRYGAQAAALAEIVDREPERQAELPLREHRPTIKPPLDRPDPAADRSDRASEPGVSTKPAFGRVETKILTPKPGTEFKTKTETKNQSAPAAKVIPPLAKARPAAEPQKSEPERIQAKTDTEPAVNPAPQIKPSRSFAETQIVEMPYIVVSEMLGPTLTPASLWVRTLAGACDFEIISMAYLPIFAAYAMLNTSLGNDAFFILLVLVTATTFIYQAVTLHISDRTFGMALLNMRLVNTDDDSLPLTRRQKLLRAWAATIAFLLPPLNLIVMRLNRNRLSLPDLMSGTSPIED